MKQFSTNEYDFPVRLSPIVAENQILIPKKSAVIRTDTNEPIGVVSDKYALVKHSEVVNSFREALNKDDYEERLEVTKGGALLFATYKLSGTQVEVKKGDFLALQFVAKNSYDGSRSFSLMMGALRLVCTNGMVIGKNFFSYSQKHLGNGVTIEPVFIKDTVSTLTKKFREMSPIMSKMASTKLPDLAGGYFSTDNVELPSYLLKEANNEYNRAGEDTLWGLYNSYTYAISHNLRKDNPQVRLDYTKRSWDSVVKLIK
jgi:hypothetical protein